MITEEYIIEDTLKRGHMDQEACEFNAHYPYWCQCLVGGLVEEIKRLRGEVSHAREEGVKQAVKWSKKMGYVSEDDSIEDILNA